MATKFKVGDEVHYTPEVCPDAPPPIEPVVPPDPPYPWIGKVEAIKDQDEDGEQVYSVITKDGKHSFDAKECELTTEVEAKEARRSARRESRAVVLPATNESKTPPPTTKAKSNKTF